MEDNTTNHDDHEEGSHIESDRHSAVSSFYGVGGQNHKNSFDPSSESHNHSNMQHQRQEHERHDSSSSFFRPNNQYSNAGPIPDDAMSGVGSGRGQSQSHYGSAGYNRDSFFMPGREQPVKGLDEQSVRSGGRASTIPRGAAAPASVAPPPSMYGKETVVEDPGWDVYNDFNNTGPRYSDAFGAGIKSEGYRQIPNPDTKSVASSVHNVSVAPDGVEMVTVPALGPDWKKAEIENMRKKTHRAERNYERRRKLVNWWRDQDTCCGSWGTRKVIVVLVFVICCIVGIILAVALPRVPDFSFNGATPLTNATNSTHPTFFSRDPANFTFPALLNLQIDTHSSIVALGIKSIHADVFDLNTDAPVGQGDFGGVKIKAKTFKDISVPVVFEYVATNASDTTWLDFYNACKNPSQYIDGVRPGFDLRLILTTSISGMLKSVKSGTQITKIACPFELPSSAA